MKSEYRCTTAKVFQIEKCWTSHGNRKPRWPQECRVPARTRLWMQSSVRGEGSATFFFPSGRWCGGCFVRAPLLESLAEPPWSPWLVTAVPWASTTGHKGASCSGTERSWLTCRKIEQKQRHGVILRSQGRTVRYTWLPASLYQGI